MNPLATYAHELLSIRSVGVKETSFYPALRGLFNEVGKSLNPKVECVINPKGKGAGIPDGGLFTADQLRRERGSEPLVSLLPARGAIEVKGTAADNQETAASDQVQKYLGRYGLVLVTNLRDFVLLGSANNGAAVELESYSLADSEADFWTALVNSTELVNEHGVPFVEFLKRVMLHAAPLATSKDLAWFLASYARDAKARIESEKSDLSTLRRIRTALEEALGFQFNGERGDHFFNSTLVQTIFYGIFSAWVLWSKEQKPNSNERFRWREAGWLLHVPVIQALFAQIATPANLKALDLVAVLDRTNETLDRVDRAIFFKNFAEARAVQYFYEPFLEAFDPQLRKDLGVWYTPTEVVQYMVARVDTALREELGIVDGLADPRVVVLDPACGTGAYLVEVLRHIANTLRDKGEDALLASKVKKAAMERVFGFEILPAPFVVAHLQLGLLLQEQGAPLRDLDDKQERAGVFLTNSLTGWDANAAKQKALPIPELEDERDAAEHIKRKERILVVLGNPPYNAFAGVSEEAEQEPVEIYKKGLISRWGIKKFNLDDLYVRFFRLAERRIADVTGQGIVCYISNFSYLSDPSYVVMRERFLKEFDKLWFDSLNGDSRETGKLTPEGKPDPSVFSTEFSREGIRVGTAVALMVRQPQRQPEPLVRYRQFWGVTKRADLVQSLQTTDMDAEYETAHPNTDNRLSFRPSDAGAAYLSWPKLLEISDSLPFNGPVERRGFALISIDKIQLTARMKAYFDRSISDKQIELIYPSLMMTGNRIVGPEARAKILREFNYDDSRIVHYPFKPFDVRWCYLENLRPLFSEPSPQLLQQRFPGNSFFISRDTADKEKEGPPFFYSNLVCDYDCISGHARHFPTWISKAKRSKAAQAQINLLSENELRSANLSQQARRYLSMLGTNDVDSNVDSAAMAWMHALAVGYSPAYLEENKDGIQQDWPRIPLPSSVTTLQVSAALGKQVAALLDSESAVAGVTAGAIRPELRVLGGLARVGGGSLAPGTSDLAVTAGWGHGTTTGVMPGRGVLVEREYSAAELASFEQGRASLGLSSEQLKVQLGEQTSDIYLNKVAFWRNVPTKVWDYTIGGYQVIKKWLSYREQSILDRPLSVEEVEEVTAIVRRIAAILLLQPQLDANYQSIKQNTFDWQRVTA